MVLAARLPLLPGAPEGGLPAAATMVVALAAHLRSVGYLSRDVVVLLLGGDNECNDAATAGLPAPSSSALPPRAQFVWCVRAHVGGSNCWTARAVAAACSEWETRGSRAADVRAWLDGYIGRDGDAALHLTSAGVHVGSLRAAFVLEAAPGASFRHMAVLPHGAHGRLANLDLVNILVAKAAEGLHIQLRRPTALSPVIAQAVDLVAAAVAALPLPPGVRDSFDRYFERAEGEATRARTRRCALCAPVPRC